MRLFIAIPMPAALRDYMERVQSALCAVDEQRSVKWTRPEQFHVTLKFLGETPQSQVPPLTDALRGVPVPPAHCVFIVPFDPPWQVTLLTLVTPA